MRQIRLGGNLDFESMLASVGDGPIHWEGQRNHVRPEDHDPVDEAWVRPAIAATLAGESFGRSLGRKKRS